jgi:hypothetical protein
MNFFLWRQIKIIVIVVVCLVCFSKQLPQQTHKKASNMSEKSQNKHVNCKKQFNENKTQQIHRRMSSNTDRPEIMKKRKKRKL